MEHADVTSCGSAGGVASRRSDLSFFSRAPSGNKAFPCAPEPSFQFINIKALKRIFSAIPQTLMAEQLASVAGLKPHSCLPCRQRKVKCDRHTPCSNCVKAGKQCSFIPPVRGKRKRTKVPKEGLHAKLRRYEELLRSYGANIEPSETGRDDTDLEAGSQVDVEMAEDTRSENRDEIASIALEERFVTKDGSSRYFDRYVSDSF
jgi:Fungal Zn(2)-Cys(6) binuclear cluster domain